MARSAGRTFLAELIGTFGLVFLGAGAVLQQASTEAVGTTGIAFAYGLAALVGLFAFGNAADAHFNPAISFAMALARRLSWGGMIRNWIAQLVGAAIAGWVLAACYRGGPMDLHLGATAVDPTVGSGMAVAVEAVLTFLLVLVFFATVVDPRAPKGFAGPAVGLAMTAGVLAAYGLTGAAMNPARSFGPAIASGYWQDHWVYWVGSLLGGGAAAALYHRFLLDRG